jgi:hypothetical protein
MTYLTSISAKQTSSHISPATVEIGWKFGDQIPDEVQIYYTIPPGSQDPGVQLPSVAISKSTKTPTSSTVQVPAPAWVGFIVAPRLVSAGSELDTMPDDSGQQVYWETFARQTNLTTAGAPVGGAAAAPGPPTITSVTQQRGRFVIEWTSPAADHFNVIIKSSTDDRGQVEIPGTWRSYGVDFVEPGLYHFGIQGCSRDVFGTSHCSAWVGGEVEVTVGWETKDVSIDGDAGFAAAVQGNNQIDVLVVGKTGAVMLAFGAAGYRGWLPLSRAQFAPSGAPLAVAHQPPNDQLDVFTAGNDGRVHVLWVLGNQPWLGPWPIVDAPLAPPGAALAAVQHPRNDQVDVFVVGSDGGLHVLWETDNRQWNQPVALTPPGFAPAGAALAAIKQPPNDQLDLFVVGNDGAIQVLWELDNGKWSEPIALTPPGFAPPGAALAAAH